MKKLLLASILFLSSYAMAINTAVWRSSHTTTADTTQKLCSGSTYLLGTSTLTYGNLGVLHGVCVNDAPAVGTIAVYDSSSTAVNAFAVMRSTTVANGPCSFFDVQVSSGLVYTTSAANDVTFLYQCF